jgi:hypothetical protein
MSLKPGYRLWICLALAISHSAFAALGGDFQPASKTGASNKASARMHTAANYKMLETQELTGTTVREYANSNGKIFAVSWTGPSIPDLRQVLGAHFADYTNNAYVSRRSHSHRSVEHTDLVVHSAGHMRAFNGFAYRPSMIPNGVMINELR